jgi:16S rRNA (uracil1498-N3)-methyltransferase
LGWPARHHLFYAPPEAFRQGRVYFPEDESAHMVSSLRLGRGDAVMATDGEGRLIEAEIEDADGKLAVARVIRIEQVAAPNIVLTLYQGIIRPRRMETVIEKCVELGLNVFSPIVTERSVERDAVARLGRWNKIAVEAMKQSLRTHAREVRGPVSFGDALHEIGDLDSVLVAHQQAAGGALAGGDFNMGRGSVGLFVGPEGGFSDDEVEALRERGARMFSLGAARLKSETAAIASVAIIRRFLQQVGGAASA